MVSSGGSWRADKDLRWAHWMILRPPSSFEQYSEIVSLMMVDASADGYDRRIGELSEGTPPSA